MKLKKIRVSLFETNSSSMHTLSIKPNESKCTDQQSIEDKMDSQGTMMISLGEYGRYGDPVETHYEKICYLMTMFIYNNTAVTSQSDFDELNEDVCQYFCHRTITNPKFVRSVYVVLDWIKENYPDIEDVYFPYEPYFYCDHESSFDTVEELFEHHGIESLDDIMARDCTIEIIGDE